MQSFSTNLSQDIMRWMTDYKIDTIKPTSYDRLKVSFMLMQKYPISRMRTTDITSSDFQGYIRQLTHDGYALSTIKKQFRLISSYMKYANAEGMLTGMVSNNVSLPNPECVEKQKKEIEIYSDEEQRRLKQEAYERKDIFGFAVMLMLRCGLRIGEVMALQYSDFDIRKLTLRINKTAVRINTKNTVYVQHSTKSHSSNRIIPITSDVADFYRMCRGKYSRNDIFVNGEGKLLSYESFRYAFRQICNDANVHNKAFHALRHTFATNCYYKGCDVKQLSKLLGHSSVNVTYNTYIHLFEDGLEDMRSIIE